MMTTMMVIMMIIIRMSMMMMTMKRMKGNLKGDDHVKQAHVASGLVCVQAHEAQGSHLRHYDDHEDNDDHGLQ